MAYPERLLSPGEEIVREFRPHWQVLAIPIAGFVVMAVVVTIGLTQIDGVGGAILAIGAVAAWIVLSATRLADWLTTQYVITNERVVYRAGVFSRSGVEIPLESVTNVSFRQTLVERMVRSGDLVIESAGETGQSRYRDIPDPEGLQSLIYQQREARTVQLSRGGGSVAEELDGLARLRDRGVLSDDEFEQQKRRLLEE